MKMKAKLRYLNLFAKVHDIDLEKFYSMIVSSSKINLQGYYSSNMVRKLTDAGFTPSFSESGYVQFIMKHIEITLTEKLY